MASMKEIKRRIRSINNTEKITKAMELVAASKMKRAISAALVGRSYSRHILSLAVKAWKEMSEEKRAELSPLSGTGEKEVIILVTSNRGLCGAYNSRVIRKTLSYIKTLESKPLIIAIGKKGAKVLAGMDLEIIAMHDDLADLVKEEDLYKISHSLNQAIAKHDPKSISVFYTDFKSAMTYIPTMVSVYPVDILAVEAVVASLSQGKEVKNPPSHDTDFEFDENRDVVLRGLLKQLGNVVMQGALLESLASEHAARMVAMKSAKEAAGDMSYALTLEFNKARQAAITQEIAEISSGTIALQ